jgi:hypothetical protein
MLARQLIACPTSYWSDDWNVFLSMLVHSSTTSVCVVKDRVAARYLVGRLGENRRRERAREERKGGAGYEMGEVRLLAMHPGRQK